MMGPSGARVCEGVPGDHFVDHELLATQTACELQIVSTWCSYIRMFRVKTEGKNAFDSCGDVAI